MSESKEVSGLQIDSDWKAQAKAEKEKLAKKAAAATEAPASGPPEASFETLLSTMATQALFAMGGIPDPRTGQRFQHPQMARQQIDLIGILDQKTKGNLTEDEEKLLKTTLYELRQRYIEMVSSASNSRR